MLEADRSALGMLIAEDTTMTDIDKARARRDALRNAGRRQTAGSARVDQALRRYLGAGLYEAQHGHGKHTADEQDADRPAGEPEV
jgi:hypothetical protein